jgi:DNA invertase Pin-like site-specific DNA recombinase
VSRWSRNIVDGLQTIHHLTENRVNIIFEQEGIDTRQPGHTLQLNLATAVAQTESESLSENLKWLYRKRAEKGYIRANKGMYFGYNTDDGNFTPDENAVYVRRIYKEFVEGKPIADIVRGLEGVKNSRGKAITPAMIRNILKNEVYKGDVHICKSISRNVITGEPDKEQYSKYVKSHHEAIVSEALWDLAQKRFKENSEKYSREEARAREEDVLAMIEDGLSRAEIAEYLGINIEKVKYTVQKLVKEGRLKEGPKGHQRSRQVEERMEKVYAAVKDGHGNDVADYLGMKYTEAHYALKKLEQGGRIRLEKKGWVAACATPTLH